MFDRNVLDVTAQPGRRVIVRNALTSDVVGYVDVPHIPAPQPRDDWREALPRTAEILKRNGCVLEPCAHCVLCGTGKGAPK